MLRRLHAIAGARRACGDLAAVPDSIESYYVVPFMLGVICLPMIALSDVLQGMSRANSWALSALSPTYISRGRC